MDNFKAKTFLEEGFLKPLLDDKNITDISYNGREIFYLHNDFGRCKANIELSQNDAKAFLRHLSNICEQQFSYSNPLLNVSFDRYRLNGVFNNVGRIDNEKAFTFSMRMASEELKINENSDTLNPYLIKLFKNLLEKGTSIVIGGVTGCGKTELQKYLISSLMPNTRVIVIDNALELDLNKKFKHLDLNVWQSDDKNKNITIQSLVKNALRSNPDWLIVAESRGEEMIDVLNSAMSGHPIITTIHSYDAETMSSRMARMVLMNDKKMDYKDVIKDIYQHFPINVYMKREIKNGKVIRYISKIIQISPKGDRDVIYRYDDGKITYCKTIEQDSPLNQEESE